MACTLELWQRNLALADAITKPPPAQLCALEQLSVCPRCSGELLEHRGEPAWVLTPADIHRVTICEQRCASASCGYRSLDGSEYFVQRQCKFTSRVLGSFELCFRHDLLYSNLRSIARGHMYYRCFTDLLQAYEDMGWEPEQLMAMQSFFRHVQAGIMDFCDRMDLPFDKVLRCLCATPWQHLNPDGITVANKQSQTFLVSTHLPQQPGPGEPEVAAVHGSAYAQRFAVRDKALRLRLHELASARGIGSVALLTLQADCAGVSCLAASHVEARAMGAFLACLTADDAFQLNEEHDTLLLPEWARTFVRLLGADSPALAIVPIADVLLVRRFVAGVRSTIAAVRTAQLEADAAQAAADAVQAPQGACGGILPDGLLFSQAPPSPEPKQPRDAGCQAWSQR